MTPKPRVTIFSLRWAILGAYLALAAALTILPIDSDPLANEPQSFLPPGTPYRLAMSELQKHFPNRSAMSSAVVVFERPDGRLSDADLAAIEAVGERIRQPGKSAGAPEVAGIHMLTPRALAGPESIRLLRVEPPPNPLISKDSQAALIVVDLPYNYVTTHSSRLVQHVRDAVSAQSLPSGLSAGVTGSAGVGYDYARAAVNSHRRTVYVTLIAIIVILLIVYRSPVAAMVPLLSISLAGFITLKTLELLQPWGLHLGTAEQIFVVVLLYGAGTDYSLLFISRYREFLDHGVDRPSALTAGLSKSLRALLASAGTNTLGLLMLCFAGYSVFRTTGPAVAIALTIALAASITLTPAIVAIAGKAMFWPGRVVRAEAAERGIWQRVADLVVRRPATVLVVVIALLAAPAIDSFGNTWAYDTLASIRPEVRDGVGNSAGGVEMVKRHWPVGEIAPVEMLIVSDGKLGDDQWRKLAQDVSAALAPLPQVRDVRSVDRPLGREYTPPAEGLVASAVRRRAAAEYLSADRDAMRMSVVLSQPPMTLAAMRSAAEIRQKAAEALSAGGARASVSILGATAEMIATRQTTQSDFRLVAGLSLGVIIIVVIVLLRDVPLSVFMVASTVLSYLATLGVCHWAFGHVLGEGGLDWKVEIFLFVVMVAVGQDYNIFLAARMSQEARTLSLTPAVRRSIVTTGPVISSCGLIMAATLGSLMAGELGLLHQLGFAFATGMLIDTFIVRPLLLPAFAVLTKRTGKS